MKGLFFKKTAYTLAEIMFVLAIIGVISTIIIHNTQLGQNQYKKLYAVAFNTLVQTAGNAALNWRPSSTMCSNINISSENSGSVQDDAPLTGGIYGYYWSRECWNMYTRVDSAGRSIESAASGGIPDYPRQYPGFLYGNGYASNYNAGYIDGIGTDTVFCKSLTSQINTIDEQNECKSFISGVRPGFNMSKGADFPEVFCALQGDVDEQTGAVTNARCAGTGSIIPSFVTSNGQKYYISTILYANPPYGVKNTKERMAFRLVVVDLNGDSGPNTQLKRGNKMPDIVLFAINSAGKVIPLGLPEFDELYLSAAVYYPKFRLVGNEYKANEIYKSNLMTFFDAKMHAWAGSDYDGVNTDYFGQLLVLSEPYSLSNFFYSLGVNCHHTNGANVNVPVCNPGKINDGSTYVDNLLGDLIWQFIYSDESDKFPQCKGDTPCSTNTFIPRGVDMGTIDTDHGCVMGESPCQIDFSDK